MFLNISPINFDFFKDSLSHNPGIIQNIFDGLLKLQWWIFFKNIFLRTIIASPNYFKDLRSYKSEYCFKCYNSFIQEYFSTDFWAQSRFFYEFLMNFFRDVPAINQIPFPNIPSRTFLATNLNFFKHIMSYYPEFIQNTFPTEFDSFNPDVLPRTFTASISFLGIVFEFYSYNPEFFQEHFSQELSLLSQS